MKTEKVKTPKHATSQKRGNEKSYKPTKLHSNNGQIGENFLPQHKESTRLQKLSLKNHTFFGVNHYDMQLDMKLDNTINRIFHEMSLS